MILWVSWNSEWRFGGSMGQLKVWVAVLVVLCVNWRSEWWYYKTHRWTDRPTHGQAQTNMPPQLLSALHDHVMSLNAQIREKHQAWHQNTLKTSSFNPTDIIQYCFLSLWVPFEDSYVLLTLFHFASIWSILTQNEIFFFITFLFHFASTMPTQNEIKKISKWKKIFHYFVLCCIIQANLRTRVNYFLLIDQNNKINCLLHFHSCFTCEFSHSAVMVSYQNSTSQCMNFRRRSLVWKSVAILFLLNEKSSYAWNTDAAMSRK